MDVSIVIPARNEEETIGQVLEDLKAITSRLSGHSFETIIVDDHSTDQTAAIARKYGTRLISNARKPGKGNALISGFETAKGDIIIMMDGDCSHRSEEIPLFLSLMQNGCDMVVGSRWTGGSDEYTFLRAFGNYFLTISFWVVSGHLLTDALNGFKSFRREMIQGYSWRSEDFEIEIELLILALYHRFRIGEFSSYERARAGGVMKSSVVRHGWRFFWCILKLGVPYRVRSLLGLLPSPGHG